MTGPTLLFAAAGAVALLLLLVTKGRVPAFPALLLTAVALALVTGTPASEVVARVQEGMAGTLGYIAVVIGLGAMIGALLERSGGAQAIARGLVARFGPDRAPWALALAGVLVATPVFFDVALVLLLPFAHAAAREAGRPVLRYALPLLAGLAVGHAFVPPTPGPVAVAGLVGADLGRVVLVGLVAGLPAVAIGGVWFGRFAGSRVAPDPAAVAWLEPDPDPPARPLTAVAAVGIVTLPLVLVLAGTMLGTSDGGTGWLRLVGHPFTALLLGLLAAIVVLRRRGTLDAAEVVSVCNRGLEPVGLIILVTGAGGVLGKVLVAAGADRVMADLASGSGLPVLLLAFSAAALVRVVQGSATVAMVTAAGLVAPLLAGQAGWLPALVTIAIAGGATVLSHVNDSGFWLVSKYLGLSEGDTFRVWTSLETIVGVVGFVVVLGLSLVLG